MSRFSGRMTDSFGYERNSKGERVGNHPRGTSRKVNHNKGIMRKHRQKLHDEAVERQKKYDERKIEEFREYYWSDCV